MYQPSEEPTNSTPGSPRQSDIRSGLRSGNQYLNTNILRPQAAQNIDIPVEAEDQMISLDIPRSTSNTVTDIEGYAVNLNPESPHSVHGSSIDTFNPNIERYDESNQLPESPNLDLDQLLFNTNHQDHQAETFDQEEDPTHQEEDLMSNDSTAAVVYESNDENMEAQDSFRTNSNDSHPHISVNETGNQSQQTGNDYDPTEETTLANNSHPHISDNGSGNRSHPSENSHDHTQEFIGTDNSHRHISDNEANIPDQPEEETTSPNNPHPHMSDLEHTSDTLGHWFDYYGTASPGSPHTSDNSKDSDTEISFPNHQRKTDGLSWDHYQPGIYPQSQSINDEATPENRNTTLVEAEESNNQNYNRKTDQETQRTQHQNDQTGTREPTQTRSKPEDKQTTEPATSKQTAVATNLNSSKAKRLFDPETQNINAKNNKHTSTDIRKSLTRLVINEPEESNTPLKQPTTGSETPRSQTTDKFNKIKETISPNGFNSSCLQSIKLFNETYAQNYFHQPSQQATHHTPRTHTPNSETADNFAVIKEVVPPHRVPATPAHSTSQADTRTTQADTQATRANTHTSQANFFPGTSIYSSNQANTQATQADTQTSQANLLPVTSTHSTSQADTRPQPGNNTTDSQTVAKKIISNTTSTEEKPEEDDTEEMPTEMMDTLTKSFNSIGIKLEPFSGSPNDSLTIDEFIDNLNEYIEATGKKSPAMIKEGKNTIPNPHAGKTEKQVLKMHLTGQARLWLKQLATNTSYEDSIKSLKSRFQLTDQEKHIRKMNVYKMTQEPNETYLDYVTRVTDKARNLDIDPKDIITIATQGSHASIKPFITMNNPKTLDDLIKMPLARADHIAKSNDLEFVNAAFTTQDNTPEKRPPQKVKFNNIDTIVRATDDDQFNHKMNRYDYNDGPYEPTERPRSPGNQFNRKRRDNFETRQPNNNPNMIAQPRNQQSHLTATANLNCGRCNFNKCPSLFSKDGICYAKDKVCGNCGKLNHYAAVCRSPTNFRGQTEARFLGTRGQNNQNRSQTQNFGRQNNYNRYPQPTRQNFNQRPQNNGQSNQNQPPRFNRQNSQNKEYTPNSRFNTRSNYSQLPQNNRANNTNNRPQFIRQNSNNQQKNQ